MDQAELIKDKQKCDSRVNRVLIILDYNAQYKKIEKIRKRHWHILLMDTHLQELLPQNPKFVYKRAPTLRDKIIKNIPDPPSICFTFCTGKGFYPCKRCFACTRTKRPVEKKLKFTSSRTGNIYEIKDFICCNTADAVYALECSCGLQYIGRMKILFESMHKGACTEYY